MRIHQLPMGARFEYEGEAYVKSGPLFATGPAGQRLIPRYAVLKPLDAPASTSPDAQGGPPVARARVMVALNAFCDRCRDLVPEAQRAEFEAARGEFLKAVDP